jgi:hypothetical protein
MKTVAIADLLDLAAANPEIALAVAGVAVLFGGIAVIILSLSSRVGSLEQELDNRTELLGHAVMGSYEEIARTRNSLAQVAKQVKRLRDEKGRFVKKPKLHDAA